MKNKNKNDKEICHIFHHNFKNIPCRVMSEVSSKRSYFALFHDGLIVKTLKLPFICFCIQTLQCALGSVFVHVYVYVFVGVCVTCKVIHLYVYCYVCVLVCTLVYVYVCILCVCMCVCVCVCVCGYAWITTGFLHFIVKIDIFSVVSIISTCILLYFHYITIQAAGKASTRTLFFWIRHIIGHFWFCAETCGRSRDTFVVSHSNPHYYLHNHLPIAKREPPPPYKKRIRNLH